MDNLRDVQNELPRVSIPLNRVGVFGLEYPCFIKRKDGGLVEHIAIMNIYVELPESYRGTHMSRFLEVLENFYDRTGQFPRQMEDFLHQLCIVLTSRKGYIELETPFVLEKLSPSSKKRSKIVFRLFMKGIYQVDTEYNRYTFLLGAQVSGNSTCPCSREISEYGAHSQRVQALVWIHSDEEIWFEDLVDIIEDSFSAPLHSLLKRNDEKFITEMSFSNPKFVEDVARDIAFKLLQTADIDAYKVDVTSFESIHLHNAYACIEENWRW